MKIRKRWMNFWILVRFRAWVFTLIYKLDELLWLENEPGINSSNWIFLNIVRLLLYSKLRFSYFNSLNFMKYCILSCTWDNTRNWINHLTDRLIQECWVCCTSKKNYHEHFVNTDDQQLKIYCYWFRVLSYIWRS